MSAASLTPLERLFVRLFIPCAAVSWSALVLAECGAFSAVRTAALALPLAVFGWWWERRDTAADAPRRSASPRWEHVGLLLALLAAAWLTGRPGEYLIEGADASVYVATGRALQQSGGLRPVDLLADVVPPAARNALLAAPANQDAPVARFSGGFDIDRDQRRLIPAFFHLLPSWMALFESVSPDRGAYYVNVLLGLLAVVAAWLLGRRAWSPAAGTAAALLLATNFGQVWFSRLPSSEMLAQCLLLAGIFFLVTLVERSSRSVAVCAALAVGLAGFARIDMLLLLTPLAGWWFASAWRWGVSREARTWGGLTLIVVSGHAVIHAVTLAGPYTQRLAHDALLVAVNRASGVGVATWLAGLAAVLIVLALARQTGLRRAAIAVTLGALLVAPFVSAPVVGSAALLFTPPGLVAVGAGFAAAVWRARDARLLPLIAPFACEAALWLAWREKTIWPDDFRRFVPAVLPLGMLFLAGLSARVSQAGPGMRRAAWLLPAAVLVLSVVQARDLLLAAPMRGVQAQLERLADRLPADAIVLTDRSLPGHFSLAMQMTCGRASVRVTQPLAPDALRDFVVRAHEAGRPVLVAVGPEHEGQRQRFSAADFDGLRLGAAGSAMLRFSKLEPSSTGLPREVRPQELRIEILELAPGVEGGERLPLQLDVGQADLGYVAGGFHPSETTGPAAVRWTKGEGALRLPRVKGSQGAALRLTLRMATFRPRGDTNLRVDVLLDGRLIGQVTGSGERLADYTVALDPQATQVLGQRPTTLVLRSVTFVPRDVGMGDDPRALGVAVDAVRVEPDPTRSVPQPD